MPGYLGEPSAVARWCPLWFEHTPAVARLHALWLAWQELTGGPGPVSKHHLMSKAPSEPDPREEHSRSHDE